MHQICIEMAIRISDWPYQGTLELSHYLQIYPSRICTTQPRGMPRDLASSWHPTPGVETLQGCWECQMRRYLRRWWRAWQKFTEGASSECLKFNIGLRLWSFWLLNWISKFYRFVRAQFMKGVVKHWPLDPLVLGAFAGFQAYQVSIISHYSNKI